MKILLAFAPFIAFAVLDRLAGPTVGLVAGALVAATLEFGTALLFGVLAVYALLGAPNWSVIGVRLAVDSGLLSMRLAAATRVSDFMGIDPAPQFHRSFEPSEVRRSRNWLKTER